MFSGISLNNRLLKKDFMEVVVIKKKQENVNNNGIQKTSINWSKVIFGKSATNPYKIREL